MAEPKREEEKIFSYDSGREEKEDRSSFFPGDDATSVDPPSGADASLAAEVQKLRAEKEDLLQTLVRRQADFENFRKRTERDRSEEGRRGVERLILDIIPVLDAFDRAPQAHDDPAYEEYRKGVTLIRKQLWDALARHGVGARGCGRENIRSAHASGDRARRIKRFARRIDFGRVSGWISISWPRSAARDCPRRRAPG